MIAKYSPVSTEANKCLANPTWAGLLVLVWDLGVCNSSRSQGSILPGANMDRLI